MTARRWRYLLVAIGCHWLANTGTVLVLVGTANALVIETVLTVVGLLSLGFVWWSQRWSSEEASPDTGSMGAEQAPA